MLEVIYNDPFTRLSLIDNADIETTYIVDDSFQVYATIEYWKFDINEISEIWQKTLEEYLELEEIDFISDYRKKVIQESIAAFKQFLENMEKQLNL